MGTAATMQIEENLALAARRGQRRGLRWGITRTEREDYRELLRTLDLGLEDRMTVKVGLLSGGQRQALTLLMAALKQPKLLLLDEHTAALDPKTAAKVLALSDQIVERERPDHSDGHPQHAGRHRPRQPPHHDERRPGGAGHRRGGEKAPDGGGPAQPLHRRGRRNALGPHHSGINEPLPLSGRGLRLGGPAPEGQGPAVPGRAKEGEGKIRP